jgi:Ser/Thr protein kinase RdoA (MazF antagonist)
VIEEFELSSNVERLREHIAAVDAQIREHDNSEYDIHMRVKIALERHYPELSNGGIGGKIQFKRYRGGADSEVYEVIVPGTEEVAKRFILKLYRPNWVPRERQRTQARIDAENEYRALEELSTAFADRSHHLAVARPVCYFPIEIGLLTEKCDGWRLDRFLRWARWRPMTAGEKYLERCVADCGEWLALFHEITSQETRSSLVLERILREFEHDLSRCRENGLDRGLLQDISREFERHRDTVLGGELKIVGRHCDFGPWNVFVSRSKLCVIDFEGFQDGVVYDDLCYFLAHLATIFPIHVKPSVRRRLHTAFLEGYRRRAILDDGALKLFLLTAMVKVMATSPVLRNPAVTWRDRRKRAMRLAFHIAWFREHLA